MGINIGICETEAPSALCKELKCNVLKVRSNDPLYNEFMEYDEVVEFNDASNVVDLEAFRKRNRVGEESDVIYLDKVKNDSDRDAIMPFVKRRHTGWIPLSSVPLELKDALLGSAEREDCFTGWDAISFEETNEACSRCKLSWDKGRGCIGAFGPDNSLLPEIAGKRGCKMIASVPDFQREGRVLTPNDAREVLKEVATLKAVLHEEGKMMVRRYSGPLDRMEAVAGISVSEGCGFYFF